MQILAYWFNLLSASSFSCATFYLCIFQPSVWNIRDTLLSDVHRSPFNLELQQGRNDSVTEHFEKKIGPINTKRPHNAILPWYYGTGTYHRIPRYLLYQIYQSLSFVQWWYQKWTAACWMDISIFCELDSFENFEMWQTTIIRDTISKHRLFKVLVTILTSNW